MSSKNSSIRESLQNEYGLSIRQVTLLPLGADFNVAQDIVAFCEQLLLTTEGGEDRGQLLRYVKSNFLPNSTLEIADKTFSQSAKKLKC